MTAEEALRCQLVDSTCPRAPAGSPVRRRRSRSSQNVQQGSKELTRPAAKCCLMPACDMFRQFTKGTLSQAAHAPHGDGAVLFSTRASLKDVLTAP